MCALSAWLISRRTWPGAAIMAGVLICDIAIDITAGPPFRLADLFVPFAAIAAFRACC